MLLHRRPNQRIASIGGRDGDSEHRHRKREALRRKREALRKKHLTNRNPEKQEHLCILEMDRVVIAKARANLGN